MDRLDTWLTFRVTSELRDSLHDYAHETGRSTGAVLRQIARSIVPDQRDRDGDDGRQDRKTT